MKIDVYHHSALDVLTILKALIRQQEKLAMTQQEILDKLTLANESLDGIQADILALKELIAQGGDLTAISDAVDALAVKAAAIDSQTP